MLSVVEPGVKFKGALLHGSRVVRVRGTGSDTMTRESGSQFDISIPFSVFLLNII